MQQRIDSIRASIDAIRKSGFLPHWRMAYADSLLNRACEYLAVDRLPEAGLVLHKLSRWVDSHMPPAGDSLRDSSPSIYIWNADMLRGAVESVRTLLQKKKMLVPSTERDAISRRLSEASKWIEEGRLSEAHAAILSLRSTLIARLRRSLRARLVASMDYRNGTLVQPSGSLVGLYNARHTLEEMFHVVGERDPIWVEDFLEIYNELFRVVERLVPEEKK